jgi:RNA-directed DNA polymerase
MQKSYGKELATHTDPESCGVTCKGDVEALTGDGAGRVFSRVRNSLRDADAVGESGRLHPVRRYRKVCRDPARSQTPCTYQSTSHGNREIPRSPQTEYVRGRIGKSKDTRR